MKSKKIYSSLLAIAAANPQGFTVGLDLQPIKHGFSVAFAETQDSFGEAGLRRVIKFAKSNPDKVSAFGGWFDKETGQFYLDATKIVEDRETAERIARINAQKAFFDLDTLTEIRVEA